MKFSRILFFTFLFFIKFLLCEEKIISDCENIDEWKIENLKGKLSLNFSLSDDSILGEKSLEVSLKSETDGVNETRITKELNEDFSIFERIEFWIKGFSEGYKFYFEVEDKNDKVKEYYFVPDFQLYDIFTPEWRRVTIKLDDEIIDWKGVKRISFKINRIGKTETKVKIDGIIALKGKPLSKIKIPKEFQRKKNGVLDLLIIKTGILCEEERWNLEKNLKEIFKDINIKNVKYFYVPWLYKGEFSSPFPSFHKEISKYDVIIFESWDTDALDNTYQQMVKDYVEGGGNLLILGGYYSFGSSKIKNKIICDLMPFETIDYFDLKRGKEILYSDILKSLNGKNVLYYHKIIPKKESNEIIRNSKGEKFGIYWEWGKGKVVAINLTTLGNDEELKNINPFWKDENYKIFLKELFEFITGGEL